MNFPWLFDIEVRKRIGEDALKEWVCSDGTLEEGELTMDLAQQLRAGGPWGQGFPEPLFDGWFQIINQRVVGDRHLKLVLQPEGGATLFDAIAFNQAAIPAAVERERIHAAYRLDINEFRGARNLQLIIEHLESR